MPPPTAIEFVEVGPRDGLQNLPEPAPTSFKLELIRRLFATGLARVEATSLVSPRWVPALADAVDLLAALDPGDLARVRVLVPNRKGLERAARAQVPNIVINLGATDTFNQKNLNRSMKATLMQLAELCQEARAASIRVDGSISVAFGCPYEGAVSIETVVSLARRLQDMGIQELSVADTIGIADPKQVHEAFGSLRRALPQARLSAHFHDTRGMALANTVAALEEGVAIFEGSVGGIGGCPFAPGASGNVASEDLLYMAERMGIRTGVDVRALVEVARWAGAELKRSLPGRLWRVAS
jgi:hydroxymethylglutaryl-CoA lyase